MWITCEQNPCRSQKHLFIQDPDEPAPVCNSPVCFHENLYQQRFARINPGQGKNSKKYYGHIFERNPITENQGNEPGINENETGQR